MGVARNVDGRGDGEANKRASARDASSNMVSSPAFVGRESALAKVSGALHEGSAMVLIVGEAGIGKTRLLHETLGSPELRDRTALVAACPPLKEPFPFGPVVEGIRRLRPPLSHLELSPLAGALRPLFPEWTGDLPPALEQLDDRSATRHRLFRALSELVEQLGVDVLVLEDAHWADTATLEWLITLTTAYPGLRGPGMSVVVTTRQDDLRERSLLARVISRLPAGMRRLRIELTTLDVEQTRRMVGSMLGAEDVSESFATFLHKTTDGVPLAVEESIRLMRERHDIIRRGGVWTRRVLNELGVPPTLRDSVLERLDRMDPEARAVLEAAAILGAPADVDLLAAVADLEQTSTRRGVSGALAAGLLVDSGAGRLRFRHVLDAKAVEAEITVSERWILHRRAAEALEQVEPLPVARLARHFREANDAEAWCRYAEAAMEAAWESGDDSSVVVVLLDLLTRMEHPIARRVRLARRLGEAVYFGMSALEGVLAEQVVQVMRRLLTEYEVPREDRGELRLLLGRMLWDVGDAGAAYAEFEAAVPDLEHRPQLAIRAMMNLALPNHPEWPATRHLSWLQRATESIAQLDSPPFQLWEREPILLLLGEDAGLQLIPEFTESISEPIARRSAVWRMLDAAEAIQVWGRYDEARAQLDSALQLIEQMDYRKVTYWARLVRAYLDWYTGAWEGLRDTVEELAESTEALRRDRLLATLVLGLLDLASGKRTSAEPRLRRVTAHYSSSGLVEPQSVLALAALGRFHLGEGAAGEAVLVTGQALDMIARKGVWLWAIDVAPTYVDALIHTGDVAQAEALVHEFSAAVGGRRAPGPAASLRLCRAMVAEATGDLRRASVMYSEAARAWAGLPRPYDELLARERQGRCLLERTEADQGLTILSGTERRLRELGARWDADRIARLLRQLGVEVPRTWRRGPQGYGDLLSPRELEVVELVARGMTNKQIAESLFISPKTVGRHISESMRKLSVTSRTALAMAAAEAGLLTSDNHP